MSTRGTLALSGKWHLYRELDVDQGDDNHVWLDFPEDALKARGGTTHGQRAIRVPLEAWNVIRQATLAKRDKKSFLGFLRYFFLGERLCGGLQ